MILQSGCPLIVAPSFHLPVDWRARTHLSDGCERTPDGVLPRMPWREADDGELALLAPAANNEERSFRNCLCLFRMPQHALNSWSRVIAEIEETGGEILDEFNRFVAEIAELLAFKEMVLPQSPVFDFVVSQTGLPSINQQAGFVGLRLSTSQSIWGGINLSDEPATLLFLNRPSSGPDDPVIRLSIAPGEGFRLPDEGLLLDRSTLSQQEPDLFLQIRK